MTNVELAKRKISGIKILNRVSEEEDTEQQTMANALLEKVGQWLDENVDNQSCRLSSEQLSTIFPGKKKRQLQSFFSNFERYVNVWNVTKSNGQYWYIKRHKSGIDLDIYLTRHPKVELPKQEIVGKIDFLVPENLEKKKKGEASSSLDEFPEDAQEMIKERTVAEQVV